MQRDYKLIFYHTWLKVRTNDLLQMNLLCVFLRIIVATTILLWICGLKKISNSWSNTCKFTYIKHFFLQQLKGVHFTVSIIFVVQVFLQFWSARKALLEPQVMSWDLSLGPPLNYWVMLWNKDESSSFWEVKRYLFLIE